MQVTNTVESVLQDIKDKHEAASNQLAAAIKSKTKSESDLDVIKAAQQAKLDEIKKLCRCVNCLVCLS